jgi:hypothetical protein
MTESAGRARLIEQLRAQADLLEGYHYGEKSLRLRMEDTVRLLHSSADALAGQEEAPLGDDASREAATRMSVRGPSPNIPNVDEIRERCARCAQRLETFGSERVDVPVSADLLLEAASLVRGYNQWLLVESVLGNEALQTALPQLGLEMLKADSVSGALHHQADPTLPYAECDCTNCANTRAALLGPR